MTNDQTNGTTDERGGTHPSLAPAWKDDERGSEG